MKVHEYQAKQLFRQFDVPVPEGSMAETAEDAFAVIVCDHKTDFIHMRGQHYLQTIAVTSLFRGEYIPQGIYLHFIGMPFDFFQNDLSHRTLVA